MNTNSLKKTIGIAAGFASVTAAFASADYGPAIWRPLSNYYTSGNGHRFHVIHDMEGYYANVYSVLQNRGVSVHYAVNGKKDATSDAPAGEVSQFVADANYAWHATCWNTYSTGCEHEGFASNPAWYTEAQYVASASVTRHLADKFLWAKDRNHVVGHGEKSNSAWASWAGANLGINAYCNTHTDPGPYWDWSHYMSLVQGSGGGGNRKGIARTANGGGYWIVAADGGVFAFGNAGFFGSVPGLGLSINNAVGICARPQGDGYWVVASDGGVFAFGSAPFQGSMGGQPLSQPVVGMACKADGTGYWLVAKDGGIFAFNAPFNGSLGGQGYSDIVGMASTPSNGYWLVRATGHIYSYGANYYGGGDAGSGVVGIAAKSDGTGYWQVRNTGQIYAYSCSYAGGANEANQFVGIARGPSNGGYWLLKKDGAVYSYGDAQYYGGANF